MQITKKEMDNLHTLIRPIIAGEKADEMIPEKKEEILASYKKDEEEDIQKYSRERRMEQQFLICRSFQKKKNT